MKKIWKQARKKLKIGGKDEEGEKKKKKKKKNKKSKDGIEVVKIMTENMTKVEEEVKEEEDGDNETKAKLGQLPFFSPDGKLE